MTGAEIIPFAPRGRLATPPVATPNGPERRTWPLRTRRAGWAGLVNAAPAMAPGAVGVALMYGAAMGVLALRDAAERLYGHEGLVGLWLAYALVGGWLYHAVARLSPWAVRLVWLAILYLLLAHQLAHVAAVPFAISAFAAGALRRMGAV